ncbi:RHS domain-containing protein [Acinetobacter sp. YH12094]|uniref:RHS domain-containing protein n=1 Tax=unclassified Acinetobacter TaxID=196816 RepID=UPI00211F1CB1|nr:RHS domain-containing protein [Acinetobacter sp. YH12094]
MLFYHCDQVGTPQTLSNELCESILEIKPDVWGNALEIKASHNLLEQIKIRFQGHEQDLSTAQI